MSRRAEGPLVVYVSEEANGYTYSLPPSSEDRIKALHPKAQVRPRLVLDQDKTPRLSRQLEGLAPQLLELMTSLPKDELATLGPVEFRTADDGVVFTFGSRGSSERTPGGTRPKTAPSPRRPRAQR